MTFEEVTKESLMSMSLYDLLYYYSKTLNPLALDALYEKYPNNTDIIEKIQELAEKDV